MFGSSLLPFVLYGVRVKPVYRGHPMEPDSVAFVSPLYIG